MVKFAVIEIDTRLMRLLSTQDELKTSRPDKISESKDLVTRALMTAVKAHKCNGCTTGQMQEVERLTERIKCLL